jgi:tetratricopeptide (TPR) repeat protein
VRGELERAHELAERLVVLAEQDEAPLSRALARRALGSTLFYLGRFADAAAALKEGITIDDGIAGWDEPAHLLLYPERAGVVCRLYLAWALWYLGFADRAVETMEAALRLGRQLPHVLALVLDFTAVLHSLRREFDAAQRCSEKVIAIAREYDLSQRLAEATICLGFALVGMGQQSKGIAHLRAGMTAWSATSAGLFETQWLGFTAQAHLRVGQLDEALAALDQATQTAAVTSECHYQAELHRLQGAVLAETGDEAEAASWFQQAINTARNQNAKSLELRAAMSLARLWAD